MAAHAGSFAEIEATFNAYIAEIQYCSMITVDQQASPRSRILLGIWEVVEGHPVGWVAAHKTPVKTAHLAHNSHTTFSYWGPSQNAVLIDAVAGWVEDPAVKHRVWEPYRKRGSPPGVGYDPLDFWSGGPTDPGYD